MVNAKSVQEIIDSLEKFNLDDVKEVTGEDYPVFASYSAKAAYEIFTKFITLSLKLREDNVNKFDNLFDEIEKITKIYSNRVFLLGYRLGIKDIDNYPGFSDEVVKNFAGEELYSHINDINKLMSSNIQLEFIYTCSKFMCKEKEGLTKEDFIEEIEKIMLNYIAQIFMAGYMIGRMKENMENNKKNKGLGISI